MPFVRVTSRRRTAWISAAVALTLPLLGACSVKSSSDDTSDGDAATTSSKSYSDRAVGVTSDTIKLGITQLDLESISNVVDLTQGDVATAYQGAIDQINADGGINGRMIEPYMVPVNPALPTSSAAACTKLTEDHEVFAVVGFFRNDDAVCYVKTHDTPIVGASLNAQQEAEATAPWFNTQLTNEHLIPRGFEQLEEQGVFDGQKVAVVGLATDKAQIDETIVPALEDLGVEVVETAINDGSANDLPAVYAQFKLIAQKFEAAGATIVVAAGGAGQAWPVGLQVNQSKYLPRMIATDFPAVTAYAGGSNAPYYPALEGAISMYAGMPAPVDVWTDPELEKCIESVTAANPDPPIGDPRTDGDADTWVGAVTACQLVHLFAEAARAAGDDLTNATFNEGGESLGEITLPGSGGTLTYGPDSHDGGLPVVIQNWDSDEKAFVPAPAD